MSYTHLTIEERNAIYRMRFQGYAEVDTNDLGKDEPDGPESRVPFSGRTSWIVLGAIRVLATASLMFARWARQK
jgi:hypothetical protein